MESDPGAASTPGVLERMATALAETATAATREARAVVTTHKQ